MSLTLNYCKLYMISGYIKSFPLLFRLRDKRCETFKATRITFTSIFQRHKYPVKVIKKNSPDSLYLFQVAAFKASFYYGLEDKTDVNTRSTYFF